MKRFIALSGCLVSLAAGAAPGADGKAVYTQVCRACHATGVAGAPILGDRAAWALRLTIGADALVASALRGRGGMPPRGGQPGLTDAQIRAAVEYMIAQSQ
jgi:cytochrome c5